MEHTFAKNIKNEHIRLRSKYYVELYSALAIFTLLGVVLIILATFLKVDLFAKLYIPLIWGSILLLYLLFMVIYFPLRFNFYQKELLITFFKEAEITGLKLIPNTLGTQEFDYETLLKEASLGKEHAKYRIGRYELHKRLIHVLNHEEEGNTYAIIHIPMKKSPYYLQVNNSNFAPPSTYKAMNVTKIAFISPYKLNYYALEGPDNIKAYLRKELESRFIDILKVREGTYQYIVTNSDEFLLIDQYAESKPLKLAESYDDTYYIDRLHNLKLLQQLLNVMLDKGR